MTFSLTARCQRTGQFGVIVASSSPAVAARCIYARAGVGAACSQNITDPTLGPALLNAIEGGANAKDALESIKVHASYPAYRQLTAIDNAGAAAAFSGKHTLGRHHEAYGTDAVAAGNLLKTIDVPGAMLKGFQDMSNSTLGDRLLAALNAGIDAGGEEGPVRSCGMLIVDEVPWATTDLRVDWSDTPISELSAIWDLWKPQAEDYVTRALYPDSAPAYGVPGDPG